MPCSTRLSATAQAVRARRSSCCCCAASAHARIRPTTARDAPRLLDCCQPGATGCLGWPTHSSSRDSPAAGGGLERWGQGGRCAPVGWRTRDGGRYRSGPRDVPFSLTFITLLLASANSTRLNVLSSSGVTARCAACAPVCVTRRGAPRAVLRAARRYAPRAACRVWRTHIARYRPVV
jgi:hypothetical protein